VFGKFLLLMKKEYRRTFFSTWTGKQRTIDFFVKGVEDEQKSAVMGKTRGSGGGQYRRMRRSGCRLTGGVGRRRSRSGLIWRGRVRCLKNGFADMAERARLEEVRKRRGSVMGSVKQLVGVFEKGEEEVRREGRVDPVA